MNKLKNILLTLFLVNTFFVCSQYMTPPKQEALITITGQKRLVLKEDGWFTISLGTLIMSSVYYIHGTYSGNGVSKPVIIGGTTFATMVGVGLHIISWEIGYKTKTTSCPRF